MNCVTTNGRILPTVCKISTSRVLVYAILSSVAVTFLMFWISGYNNNFIFRHEHLFPENIFLIETSGSGKLNPRQACAVESAARRHTHSEVQVMMFSSEPPEDTYGLSRLFSNIHLKPTKFENIFTNTLLWDWYRKGNWKNSVYRVNDLSDAIRALLVWKYGGLYLDLDTVTLRAFYGKRNFLIKQPSGDICNGIFSFESQHPLLSKYLKMFPESYRKGTFGSVGPSLFTKLFRSICRSSLSEGIVAQCNLTLLPSRTAFPINWPNWRDYFRKIITREVPIKTKDSYLIHVWNFLSSKQLLSVNSGTLYEKVIKENCPVIYDYIVRYASLNSSFRF